MKNNRKLVVVLVVLVAVVAVALIATGALKKEAAPVAAPVVTEAPTQAPTATPTAEPTAEPTTEPTAESAVEATADPVEEAALAEEAADISADAVVATLNGENLTWGDVEVNYNSLVSQYSSYYDMADPANVDLFRAVALENAVIEMLMNQKAVELGVSELTAEEIAEAEAAAQTDWSAAIDNYLSYFYPDLTAESPAEEIAAAEAEAEQYYKDGGYDPQVLAAEYKEYMVLNKVQNLMTQDATVTDEEVEALYQELVAADKELYENNVAAYMEYNNQVDMMAMYAAMYGSANDMDYAWYKPEGFRAVRHILLPVDEELMNNYTDLQARLEEQKSAELEETVEATETETAEAAETAEATVEPTAEPVTEDMVNEAKAAIFASLADKIEEINQKVVEGVDFDELITTYGVDADGNPSDPGMVSTPYYEVCAASTSVYVTEFVEAAMSIPEVGGISAPYLSSFGVHIVKYLHDIPGGPVEMTDAQREAKRVSLLQEKQNELYSVTIEKWMEEAKVEYTGVVTTYEELMAAETAAAAE